MGKVKEINDADFSKEVLNSAEPVMVDFWAPWCGPCTAIAPLIDELAGMFEGKMKFCKVNVDGNKQYAAQFNVRAIPCLLFFKGGQLVEQIQGVESKQKFVEVINSLVAA